MLLKGGIVWLQRPEAVGSCKESGMEKSRKLQGIALPWSWAQESPEGPELPSSWTEGEYWWVRPNASPKAIQVSLNSAISLKCDGEVSQWERRTYREIWEISSVVAEEIKGRELQAWFALLNEPHIEHNASFLWTIKINSNVLKNYLIKISTLKLLAWKL